jgi:hypothetical protein
MNPHVLVATLADYTLGCIPWLAAHPMLLALLIAVGPMLLLAIIGSSRGRKSHKERRDPDNRDEHKGARGY